MKPVCNLYGINSNVFVIIGHVAYTLKRAGFPNEAKAWREEAVKQHSYDDVLRLMSKYVEPTFERESE